MLPFLFPEEIASRMLGFKLSLLIIILTFVLFTGGIQFESADVAYSQSEAPYANCILMIIKDSFVQLSMDDDCNESEWTAAVQHYKANGYPNEDSYMDMIGSKFRH